MNPVKPSLRKLAARLLQAEEIVPNSGGYAIVEVCEKFRKPLSALAGVAGFHSLLARALILAERQVAWLRLVQVEANGSLTVHLATEARLESDEAVATEGGIALVSQLLGLLTIFIGEGLTMRLVQEIWPGESLDDDSPDSGQTP